MSMYQEITNRVVDALEKGATGAWSLPWQKLHNSNLITNKGYRGINTLILACAAMECGFTSNKWGTFNQWKSKDLFVRKGEKGTRIVFWSPVQKEEESFVVARSYTVFNGSQIDGFEEATSRNPIEEDPDLEKIIAESGADFGVDLARAFYSIGEDKIYLPNKDQFKDKGSYYSTALHELTHWTGAKNRLNRELTGNFGSERYAMEELVAELGASMILGVHNRSLTPRDESLSYLNSWINHLKASPKVIFGVASKAQAAADYIIKQESSEE